MLFARTVTVRFRHCDPAGIVFYPRYFEMMNDLLEDWFAEMGWGFGALHADELEGVPTVKLSAEFLAPSRLGDELVFTLEPARLGASSFDLVYTARCGEEARLRVNATLVYVSNAGEIESLPIPDGLRERMKGYLAKEVKEATP